MQTHTQVVNQLEQLLQVQYEVAAEHLAQRIAEITGVTPENYKPVPAGLQWLGFTFYESFDYLFESTTVRAYVALRVGRGRRTKTIRGVHEISNTADLHELLTQHIPYKE